MKINNIQLGSCENWKRYMCYHMKSSFPINSHGSEILSGVILLTILRLQAIKRQKAKSGLGQTMCSSEFSSHAEPGLSGPKNKWGLQSVLVSWTIWCNEHFSWKIPLFCTPEYNLAYVILSKESCPLSIDSGFIYSSDLLAKNILLRTYYRYDLFLLANIISSLIWSPLRRDKIIQLPSFP